MIKEEKVTIAFDKRFPLDGILTLPDRSAEPDFAVVFVHGSGPNDMDETIGNTTLFKDLAKKLAEYGIASVRYDKRTKVYPEQFITNPAATVEEETIQDALFATQLLKSDPRIDSGKIFIVGHSMGGCLAPRIDEEGGNYAGLIILAGSPRRLEEIILSQNEAVMSSLDEATKNQVEPQLAALKVKFDSIYHMTDQEAQKVEIFPHVRAYYLKEWGEKPVENFLSVLTKPVFIAQGEEDFQVSIEKDFEQWKKLLSAHPNAVFKRYPNLTHVFTPSQGFSVAEFQKEYETNERTRAVVIKDIFDFIESVSKQCGAEKEV